MDLCTKYYDQVLRPSTTTKLGQDALPLVSRNAWTNVGGAPALPPTKRAQLGCTPCMSVDELLTAHPRRHGGIRGENSVVGVVIGASTHEEVSNKKCRHAIFEVNGIKARKPLSRT